MLTIQSMLPLIIFFNASLFMLALFDVLHVPYCDYLALAVCFPLSSRLRTPLGEPTHENEQSDCS